MQTEERSLAGFRPVPPLAADCSEADRLAELKDWLQDWLQNFPPDAPALVMTIYNAYEDVVECLDSLLTTIPPRTPLILLDDASPDQRLPTLLGPLSQKRGFAYLRKAVNRGVVHSGNIAFEWCAPRDVVILNSDIVLPHGWLERLREAAYSRSSIGTVTPFTNNGAIYSIPYRNQPLDFLPGGMTVNQIDQKIEAVSQKSYPLIPSAITFCTYFKRAVLDVVGYYDEIFAPGYGEEVDFSQRVIIAGFSNVLADNVFVFHKGSRSFGTSEKKRQIQESHEQIVASRYPWHHPYVQWLERTDNHPLPLALERARAALLGLRVAIDATCIVGYTTGTQLQLLEQVQALLNHSLRQGDYVALIMRDEVPLENLLGLDKQVSEIFRVSQLQNVGSPIFDVVHRPFQIFKPEDLLLLKKVGRRFVFSCLDSIAFANPSYFGNVEEWMQARAVTRAAFELADGVAFNSQDAYEDARQQGLYIEDNRYYIAYNGANHTLHTAEPTPPAEAAKLGDRPFLLMLGTNFRHKNRAYAIKLLKHLVEDYGWDGQLVFAGPNVAWGSSNADEALERLNEPALAERISYLGGVSEGEKNWLLQNTALVLYPSNYEGFGLIPFEAAQLGKPVLTSKATSLAETLGDEVLSLTSLNPLEGAKLAWTLLTEPETARQQVVALQERAATFTWEGVAERNWQFYRQLMQLPPRPRLEEYNFLHEQHEYRQLDAEYKKLQEWATQLKERVESVEGHVAYRALSRFKLV